jgi:hypothetical protein
VGQPHIGNGLCIGIDYGTLCSSGFLGYLAGYCRFDTSASALRWIFRQVTLPSVALCSLVDSAVRNAVLICDLTQRFYASTVIKLDAFPIGGRTLAGLLRAEADWVLFLGLDTASLDAMDPMLLVPYLMANPSRVTDSQLGRLMPERD